MATASTGFSGNSVGGSIGVPGDGALALAGISGGSVSATNTGSEGLADYTVVVQIPIPFANLSLDLDLAGAFVLPIMTAVGVPQAMQFLIGNISNLVQNIINDATLLISAIPDTTFTIQVKLGPVVIYSVQLVAEKVPMVINPPTFQLALPNFGADAGLSVGIPGSAATILRVPIPVPVYEPVPLLGISGGRVSVGANAEVVPGQAESGAGAVAGTAGGTGAAIIGPSVIVPTPVNPVYLPNI